MWMVERNSQTEPRLQFSSTVVEPTTFEPRQPFWTQLKAAIAAQTTKQVPAPLRHGDNVVVLTHALPPGGAERQWCYLAGELKRMGHNVDFVTLFPLEGDNTHYRSLLVHDGVRLTELVQRESEARELLAEAHSTLARIIAGGVTAGMSNPFGQQLHDLVDLCAAEASRCLCTARLLQRDCRDRRIAGAVVPQIVLSFRNYNPSNFSYLANDWFQPLYSLLAQSPSVLFTGNSRAANADYARWIGIDERRVKLVPNAIDVQALSVHVPQRRMSYGASLG